MNKWIDKDIDTPTWFGSLLILTIGVSVYGGIGWLVFWLISRYL